MILVEEISHRVINEFTQAVATIALAAAEASDPAARQVLVQTAAQLRAHAEAHRVLRAPMFGQRYDVGEYLSGVCSSIIKASLADTQIELTLVVGDIDLTAERCWRLGLVVSELITNAARHGLRWKRGEIVVEVVDANEVLRCHISDNGRSKPNPSPGRGLALVSVLVADLGGTVQWSFGEAGTTAEVVIPREGHHAPH